NFRQRRLIRSAEHLAANKVRQAARSASGPRLFEAVEFHIGEAKHDCSGPRSHLRPAIPVPSKRLPPKTPRLAAPAMNHVRIHLKRTGYFGSRSPHLQAADRGRLTFFGENSSLGSHVGSRFHPATTCRCPLPLKSRSPA